MSSGLSPGREVHDPLCVLSPELRELVLRFESAARACTREAVCIKFSIDRTEAAAGKFRLAQCALADALQRLEQGESAESAVPPEGKFSIGSRNI